MDAGTVLVVLYAVVLVLLLVPVVRRLALEGNHRACGATLRGAKLFVLARLRKKVDMDPFEKQVRREVLLRFASTSKIQLQAVVILGIAFCCNAVLKFCSDEERAPSVQQDAIILTMFTIGGTCQLFEHQVLGRFSEAWKIAIIALLSLFIAAADNQEWFLTCYGVGLLVRVLLSLAVDRILWIAAVNICYSVAAVVGRERWEAIEAGQRVSSFAVMETVICAAVVLFASGYRHAVYASARQTLEIRTLTAGRSALEGVLKILCDVVVVLDNKLCLDKHYPNLSSILLLNAQRNLAHTSILNFVAPGEEERLETMLLTSANQVLPEDAEHSLARAGSIQVTFLDSDRNRCDVELFYMPFSNLGEKGFLVGIREDTDRRMTELKPFPRTRVRRPSHRSPESEIGTPGRIARQHLANQKMDQLSDGSDPVSEISPRLSEERSPRVQSADALRIYNTADRGSASSSAVEEPMRAKIPEALGPEAQACPLSVPNRPDCIRTSNAAKEILLVRGLMQWNIGVPRAACCAFHAALSEATIVAARCQRNACMNNFKVHSGDQCQGCGRLWECRGDARHGCCVVCGALQVATEQLGGSANEVKQETAPSWPPAAKVQGTLSDGDSNRLQSPV